MPPNWENPRWPNGVCQAHGHRQPPLWSIRMRLDNLEIAHDAIVASVESDDKALRQHILDMGLTPGTEVTMMKYAPMGDPLEIHIRGYELTLRAEDARNILVAPETEAQA